MQDGPLEGLITILLVMCHCHLSSLLDPCGSPKWDMAAVPPPPPQRQTKQGCHYKAFAVELGEEITRQSSGCPIVNCPIVNRINVDNTELDNGTIMLTWPTGQMLIARTPSESDFVGFRMPPSVAENSANGQTK